MPGNLYLFQGVNSYQINQEIKQLVSEYQLDELSYVKYDAEEVTLNEILNDCETLPFFSDQKIIMITNPIFLSSEKSKLEHNVDRFITYLNHPNPQTILIINADGTSLDKKKKVNKKLLEKAIVKNYDHITDQDAELIIQSKFKELNCKISFDAINELIERTECDALKLHSELDKLTFYIEEGKEITTDDIKLLVCEPVEHNIFQLTNNIIDKNHENSVHLFHKLLTQNEEPIVFTAILATNFHYLYLLKQYQKKSYSETELKNIIKLHPYQLKKLYKIAQRTKEDDIKKYIKALNEYDLNVKSGQIDKNLGFELFILNM